MDEDCIRLTSYFQERQRADGRPLADALADLYARRDIAASIVLRGTGSTLSAIAVGSLPAIEPLAGQVVELTPPGHVTTVRARLLTGDIDPVWLGESPGEATRLTVYFGRHDRVYQVPAFEAVCELLYRRGIAGASVLPGIDGTVRGQRQHPQFLRRDSGAPLMAIAVGAGNEIGMVLPELATLFRHPIMTVEKVRVCKRDGHLVSRPALPPAGELPGAERLRLTAYTSEAARHDGQPLHRAIVRQLRLAGLASATTVRGIWGFHADHAPHGAHFPHWGHHVPAVTAVTGTPEQMSAAFDVIDALTSGGGLVTAETVWATEPMVLPRSPGS